MSDRLLDVSGGRLAGDAAEGHDVGLSVAAEAVAAVHAARDFTRGEETRDGLAFLVEDLRLGVDLQTAHGVVNGGLNLDGPVRSLVESGRHVGTAELRVLAGLLVGGVLLERGFKRVGRKVRGGGEFLDVLARDGEAHLDVALDELGLGADAVVPDDPGELAGLLQFVGGHDVARQEFVREALAFGVDENGAVAADAFGNQNAFRRGRRVSLDLVHVDRGRTDLLGHDDAVARGARMVRRGIALEHGLVLDEHFLVGAETAGGDHDGLGVDRVGLAVLGGELDARNGAVLARHDVGDAGVRADVDLAVLRGGISLHGQEEPASPFAALGGLFAGKAEDKE